MGRVTRSTVSVLVDDLPAPAAEDGKVSYVPWKEADLERLTALVKNAIGYNAARGDTVTVVNSPFLEEHMDPIEPVPFWTQTVVHRRREESGRRPARAGAGAGSACGRSIAI